MPTYADLEEWLRRNDRASYYGLQTLLALQGESARATAAEILGFISRHYRGDCLADYTRRLLRLRMLQQEFERTGSYPASCYAQVKPVADEEYKLALLLSFVCTNHRFEILKCLESFLRDGSATGGRLLSIGYGTGYELKVARTLLPDWTIDAFDSSEASQAYAEDLLGFFQCQPVNLIGERFPLETPDGLERYRAAFGKVVVCELLEHLERPDRALANLREVLADRGQIFLTMAINIAQEDHVFLYRSPQQARAQVLDSGYRIVTELLAPAVTFPFEGTEREKIFRKGNYICVAEKA